jgi:hypothetical protein
VNRSTRPTRGVVLPAMAVLLTLYGVAAVRIGYPSFDARNALLVLLAGLTVGASGLVTLTRAPWSRIGPLLVAASAAWFTGGLRSVAWPPLADLADALDLVYAGILAHALLTAPSGQAQTRAQRLAILGCYLAALAPVARADLLVGVCLGVGLIAVWFGRSSQRRQRRVALAVGLLFAAVLGGHQLARTLVPDGGRLDTRPALQVAFVVAALGIAVPLVRSVSRPRRVSDVVVELGSGTSRDLAGQLARLLGDRDLVLGMWSPVRGGYVDSAGRSVTAPPKGSGLRATLLQDEGPLAILVHRQAVALDPGAEPSVRGALQLAAANARLQEDVRAQLAEVQASRRRLLVAADEERDDLERRVTTELGPTMDALASSLSDPPLAEEQGVAVTREHLEQARAELSGLIRGFGHPSLQRGVAGAIEDLAAMAPVPVELRLEPVDVASREVQVAAIFVVSEALANVSKHARPTRASVRLGREGVDLVVEVRDDGRGGADPEAGRGLQGLRDRVEALGGHLAIESRPGGGTRVRASLPLEGGSA